MRKKRLVFWLAVVLLLIGSVVVIFGLFSTPDRVGPENYARIQDGMTLDDVEGILGKLNENGVRYEGITIEAAWANPITRPLDMAVYQDKLPRNTSYVWYGPTYLVGVTADYHNRIGKKELHVKCDKPGLWQRLKERLHLKLVH